jgi:NADPH2:quinone reductase
MRAWQHSTHGAPLEVLAVVDADEPVPAHGQVAVAVAACGLNFADSLLCQGTYQERPPLPSTPGIEVCGVVTAVGDGVPATRIGERVVALPALPHGGLAERCLARAADAWPVPDAVDDTTAAAIPITYGTAWVGLFRRGGLRAGDTVLVHAAAGATGAAAVQLAAAAGARVLATAGGAAKVAEARGHGADESWDSRAEGFDVVEAVRGATGGRGVDVVFDPVGGDLFDASRRVVAFEGRYVVVGNASGRVPQLPTNHLLVKNYAVVGLHWGLYRTEAPEVLLAAHEAVMAEVVAGRLRPAVGAVHPFDQAATAIAALAAGRTSGKQVVAVQADATGTGTGTPPPAADR